MKIILSFALLSLFALFACSNGQTTDPLTREERAWLSAHNHTIVLGHDHDARPIDFLDAQGNFTGLAADYVALLEEKLDFNFNIVNIKPWSEVVKQARERKIDVLCAFSMSPEREEWMLFTEPYIEIKIVILTANNDRRRLTLENMDGMRVSYTKGWITDEYLQKYSNSLELVPAANPDEAMNLLATGNVDAWITALTVASNKIEEHAVSNIHIAGETDLTFNLSFASRKDWPVLHSILTKGLALIDADERKKIHDKWISLSLYQNYTRQMFLIFGISSGIIIILILLILLWNMTLRHQVRLRTHELQKELEERKAAQTAQKETKDFLHSIINNTNNIVYVKNPDGQYILVNESFEEVFGVVRENILGKTDREIFGPELVKILGKEEKKLVKKNSAVHFEQKLNYRSQTASYLVTKFTLVNSKDEVYRICTVFVDISEQKQSQEYLNTSLKEKEVLLREIHHRVKNNLQITASLLDLHTMKTDNQAVIEVFRDVRNKIGSMSLVHEMLYRSNEVVKIDFADYVRDLVNSLFVAYTTDQSRIDVSIDISDIFFEVDIATPCGLIICELVSNALKHSFGKEQSGEIKIVLHKNSEGYILEVSDNGKGFSNDFDFATSDSFGLKLVRLLVEGQLDGEIDIKSDNGVKYTIQFREPEYTRVTS